MAKNRNPPVSIPLSFDTALGGLLKVDPKKLPTKKKPVTRTAKKPAKKAAPKRAAKK